jgi:tetratricopeptide (TPR) repeat protein
LEKYSEAIADFSKALSIDSNSAFIYTGRAWTYYEMKNYDKALEDVSTALRIEPDEIEYTLDCRSNIYRELGRYDEAIKYIEDALKVAKDNKDVQLRGSILIDLGRILDSSGDYERSLETYDEALKIKKEENDLSETAKVLNGIGVMKNELLRFGDAKKALEEARLIYQVTGERLNEAKVISNLGKVYLDMGDLDEALSLFLEAEKIYTDMGRENLEGINLLWIGEVYFIKGDYKEARSAFDGALAISGEDDPSGYGARALAFLGAIDYLEGSYSSSYTLFSSALSENRKLGSRIREADDLIGAGMAFLKMGKIDVARGYFEEAKKTADELNIHSIGWRAVFGDGLVMELTVPRENSFDSLKGNFADLAQARFEDALFRFRGMPEIAPDIYGAHIISPNSLINKLYDTYGEKGLSVDAEAVKKKGETIKRLEGLIISGTDGLNKKETGLLESFMSAVGEVHYLEKRLGDEELRGGENVDTFSIMILGAQGKVLKSVEDIKKGAPSIYDSYFKDIYE